ncbi:MAG: hypothetical protein RLZZ182_2618 [Pseudomonadota bacterium]
MQVSKIALAAVAALSLAGTAQAGTRYLTGASATALNATKALVGLCTDAAGTATIFKQDATATSLGNFFTVQCSKNFAGLADNTVAFNVDGGSFTAVEASTGGVGVKFVPAAGGTATAGSGNLAGLALRTGVTATGTQLSEGGFMDVEPAAFGSLTDPFGGIDGLAGNVAPAAFSQVFGVAVSKALYTALQSAQGITSACGSDDRAPACQPSISRAQYATIVSSNFNAPKTEGAAFLGGPVNTKLTLCRRVDTSGTQAASNQYFLNNLTGGTPGVLGGTAPASASGFPLTGTEALATFGVSESATTSQARTCLASTSAYNIGVLSLENTPATTDNYRFVKLSRVEAFDVTGTNRSKATAKTGEYDFVFNSFKYTAGGAGSSDVIEAIDGKLGDLTNNNGLFGNTESSYSRGGNNANVITKQ